MTLRKILVAVDFSAASEPAVEAALELARRSDGSVTLFHVCELPAYSSPGLGMYVPAPEMNADIAPPAAAIVRYASAHDFDLVVVGSHGRRGFRRLVLGSAAEAVVRTADRPVLTVHRHAGSDATAPASAS